MNIYALSSGRGPSGIAIVRISGSETLKICQNLTKSKVIKSNEVNFCKFYDPKNDNVIDPEALLLWFPGPNSYTAFFKKLFLFCLECKKTFFQK